MPLVIIKPTSVANTIHKKRWRRIIVFYSFWCSSWFVSNYWYGTHQASGIRHQAYYPTKTHRSPFCNSVLFFWGSLRSSFFHFVNENIEFSIANLFFFDLFFFFFWLARAAGCWLLVAALIFILTKFSPFLIFVRHWALPIFDFFFVFFSSRDGWVSVNVSVFANVWFYDSICLHGLRVRQCDLYRFSRMKRKSILFIC